MLARIEDLLPVEYFWVVFTPPAPIADIAYHNKAAVCGLLFKASARTLLTIAADPKYPGARIGMTSVLHRWGSAVTRHPHVHVIVAGKVLSLDGTRWIGCRPGGFLTVRVLSQLFRRLFLERLVGVHKTGKPKFFGKLSGLAGPDPFATRLALLRETEWVACARPRSSGPEAVLAYLGHYARRVAISNHRLISAGTETVAFRRKDDRIKRGDRKKVIRLPTDEFLRRDRIGMIGRLLGSKPEPEEIAEEEAPKTVLTNRTSFSLARDAVARCVSSKPSGAAKSQNLAHRHGRSPHDPAVTTGREKPRQRTGRRDRFNGTCAATGSWRQKKRPTEDAGPEYSSGRYSLAS